MLVRLEETRPLRFLLFGSDIPPDVDSFTIGIHNAAKRSKHSSIGEVAVHFRRLNSGKTVDAW